MQSCVACPFQRNSQITEPKMCCITNREAAFLVTKLFQINLVGDIRTMKTYNQLDTNTRTNTMSSKVTFQIDVPNITFTVTFRKHECQEGTESVALSRTLLPLFLRICLRSHVATNCITSTIQNISNLIASTAHNHCLHDIINQRMARTRRARLSFKVSRFALRPLAYN